jgi:hypothetical protein
MKTSKFVSEALGIPKIEHIARRIQPAISVWMHMACEICGLALLEFNQLGLRYLAWLRISKPPPLPWHGAHSSST